MKTSEKGIEFIKNFEKCKLEAYKALPSEQYWTIGYGHYGADVVQGMTISQADADEFLKRDLGKSEKYVEKTGLQLNQDQFDALVSFTYNCGPGNLLKLVAGRTIPQVGTAILKYNKADGKILKGLKRRREAEYNLYFGKV